MEFLKRSDLDKLFEIFKTAMNRIMENTTVWSFIIFIFTNYNDNCIKEGKMGSTNLMRTRDIRCTKFS